MVTFKNGYAEVTFEGEENEFDGQNNDVNAWVEWTISKEFDTRVIDYIKLHPSQLCQIPDDNCVVCFPCPRSWNYVNIFLKNYTDYEVIIPLVKGAIGAEAGEKFINYIKFLENNN